MFRDELIYYLPILLREKIFFFVEMEHLLKNAVLNLTFRQIRDRSNLMNSNK